VDLRKGYQITRKRMGMAKKKIILSVTNSYLIRLWNSFSGCITTNTGYKTRKKGYRFSRVTFIQ